MRKLNWKQRLEELEGIEAYDDKAMRARGDAETWGCCSVAQKMLGIDKAWDKISAANRHWIMIVGPERLFMLGANFSRAVDDEDYVKALKIHEQIQNYPLDEKKVSETIKSKLPA